MDSTQLWLVCINNSFLKGYRHSTNRHSLAVLKALDFLAIAVNELANISERRIDRLVNKGKKILLRWEII